MARGVSDSPENWFGTRTVIRMEGKCGWCNTNDCANCNHELGHYEKLWICGCKCNNNWEPQAVVVERKEQNEKTSKPNTSTRSRREKSTTVGTRTESPEKEPSS